MLLSQSTCLFLMQCCQYRFLALTLMHKTLVYHLMILYIVDDKRLNVLVFLNWGTIFFAVVIFLGFFCRLVNFSLSKRLFLYLIYIYNNDLLLINIIIYQMFYRLFLFSYTYFSIQFFSPSKLFFKYGFVRFEKHINVNHYLHYTKCSNWT